MVIHTKKNGYLVSTENIVCRQKVEPFLWLVPKDPTLSPESVESSFRLVGRTEHILLSREKGISPPTPNRTAEVSGENNNLRYNKRNGCNR